MNLFEALIFSLVLQTGEMNPVNNSEQDYYSHGNVPHNIKNWADYFDFVKRTPFHMTTKRNYFTTELWQSLIPHVYK